MVPPRYKTRLFYGPWRDPVHVHIRIRMCSALWNVEHSLAMVSLNIYNPTQMNKRRKFGRKTQVWDWKWNWRSRSINPKINRDLNSAKMHFLVQVWKYLLQLVVTYCADKLTCSKWGKFWLLSSIWPWRSRSIAPQNKRDLNQGLLHLWSKFGDPSLNSWWIIVQTSSWLTDIHTHIHAGNDNTRRPKLALYYLSEILLKSPGILWVNSCYNDMFLHVYLTGN